MNTTQARPSKARVARFMHEVEQSWRRLHREDSGPPWLELPPETKRRYVEAVVIIEGNLNHCTPGLVLDQLVPEARYNGLSDRDMGLVFALIRVAETAIAVGLLEDPAASMPRIQQV